MKEKEIFLAITGDIVNSRSVKNRTKLQEELLNICERVNNAFVEYIRVKFSITIGDEIQGLIKKESPIFNILEYFEKELYPVRIRFGIGEGTVSTPFYSKTNQMDGECFLNSRKAIEQAKKEDRLLKLILKHKKTEILVDMIVLWIERTKREWNNMIYRRFWLYKELKSIEKVAKKEGVTKQSVGESLKRAKYDIILKSQEIINRVVSGI